jgi:sec-independent protein translocase protein TatA
VGTQELVIILLIVLVLFGGRKLPDLARSIGVSLKEFRKASDDEAEAESDGDDGPARHERDREA